MLKITNDGLTRSGTETAL